MIELSLWHVSTITFLFEILLSINRFFIEMLVKMNINGRHDRQPRSEVQLGQVMLELSKWLPCLLKGGLKHLIMVPVECHSRRCFEVSCTLYSNEKIFSSLFYSKMNLHYQVLIM